MSVTNDSFEAPRRLMGVSIDSFEAIGSRPDGTKKGRAAARPGRITVTLFLSGLGIDGGL